MPERQRQKRKPVSRTEPERTGWTMSGFPPTRQSSKKENKNPLLPSSETEAAYKHWADKVVSSNFGQDSITDATKSFTSVLQRTTTMITDATSIWGDWISDQNNIKEMMSGFAPGRANSSVETNINELSETEKSPLVEFCSILDFKIAVQSQNLLNPQINGLSTITTGELTITCFCNPTDGSVSTGLKVEIQGDAAPYDIAIYAAENVSTGQHIATILHKEDIKPIACLVVNIQPTPVE